MAAAADSEHMSVPQTITGHNAGEQSVIMVDVDDTICDFKNVFCAKVRAIYEVDVDPETHDTWECLGKEMALIDEARELAPGTAFNVVLAACYHSEQIMGNVALQGAPEALQRLAERWDVWYVTDRPEDAYAATSGWLAARGFPNPTQVVCTKDKRTWLTKRRGRIHTIIDDRVRTLLHGLIHVGCEHVHGLMNRLNSDLTDSDNVHLTTDWEQIVANVERLATQPATQR